MKPIVIYKLTPVQISLVERLASNARHAPMADLSYREVVAHQELQKLAFIDLQVGQRKKLLVVLTEGGETVRQAGYFSRRPVVRVTGPQINLLRFLDDSDHTSIGRHSSEIPATMLDVCRRMALRGWVEWQEHAKGGYWAKLTDAGQEVLLLLDTTQR